MGRWGISQSDGSDSRAKLSSKTKKKALFWQTRRTKDTRRLLPALSSTYIREWWASSCAASFWTSLWSPAAGTDPGASWQGAPGRPRPVPPSTPSHSQPCPSRLSPQKTRWTAAGPPLLLSFFHVKPPACFTLFLNKSIWMFLFPPSEQSPVQTGGAKKCIWKKENNLAVQRCSQSCQPQPADVL